jgi:hypothetical protein
VLMPDQVVPVVQSSSPHAALGDLKAKRANEMEVAGGCDRSPTDVARVLGNQRFDEDDPAQRIKGASG